MVAPTDSTVLIEGETGTGKEAIAHAVHARSARRDHPFVKLNCAAIPAGLLESEIFGHERGAFTGAVARTIGRFEAADHGTLFLDEVGDMPLELQAKLLRVLQEREFERVGSCRTQRVDVRVVAATNQDLPQLVAERKFRSDLYYRLNVFPITLPALRDRCEDIPLLVAHFIQIYAERMNKQIAEIPTDAMDALLRHSWPGNIRELQHLIERAVILTPGNVLHLPGIPQGGRCPAAPVTLEDVEKEHILSTLRTTNWIIGGAAGAAARLGVPRTTLLAKMRRRGLMRPMVAGVA
jgi:formate hydrogenlyase transcriptional activator